MKYFSRFFYGLQQDFKAFLYWCLVFSVFRAIFILCYVEQLQGDTFSEVLASMWLGLRLSLKTAGIIMLISAVAATLPGTLSKKWPSAKLRLLWHGCAAIFFSICFFARIPYYKIFNSAFNMMLINGAHDDKYAIFMTAVEQYQLLYRLPAALITGLLIVCILKKLWEHTVTVNFFDFRHKRIAMLLVIIGLPVFWIFVRYGGAFSYSSSINWESAARTKSNLLNEAILDDGQALYRVYIMKQMLEKTTDVNIPPSKLRQKIAASGGNKDANTISVAFTKTVTKPKLNRQPNNVVVIIGESFGLWPFLPEFRDLGLVNESLRLQDSADGAAVKYMLANGSGTIAAVNGIVTGLPDTGLYENYQPRSMQDKYESGIGYIMHKMGYKTVFWYGGFSGWQNIKEFVLAQSFDEFHCADEFSYTGGNAWGCPDKVLFDNVSKYIKKQSADEKVLHVILTSSNHPPYTIDVDKEGFLRDKVKEALPESIAKDDKTLTELGHIWYADQAIGQFADELIKEKPDSLMVITGDHSERFTFAKEQDIKTLSAIPCIIYGAGLNKQWFDDTVGCHIQIPGMLAELIAPAGFKYTAFLPDIFQKNAVFNHRLYADGNNINLLSNNQKLFELSNNAKSIAAWRILKGENINE